MMGCILVLTNSLGGLYSFRKEVMKAIVDNGYQLYISAQSSSSVSEDFFEGIGSHIIFTDFNRRGMNPFSDIRLLLTYRRLIKQIKPLAVLTYTIKPNVYGGIACRLTRTHQIANVTGLGDALENGGWLQRITIILYRIGLRNAYRVFFQNSMNRLFCIRLGIANKDSIVLPGSGVNLSYHCYQNYAPDGMVKFLFIARLLKDKGTDEYFETAKAITEKYPHVEFQVLGSVEGDYQRKLDFLGSAGTISYLGKTTDIRPFLRDVHCTVLPSYHEGMSNVNLESAANGRPVITTNVPGCRETVEDGKTGYLVEAKSVQSLISAVEKFIKLPYYQKESMGREARKKVERDFDRQIVIDSYINTLKSIRE